jgi:hypothetical protein
VLKHSSSTHAACTENVIVVLRPTFWGAKNKRRDPDDRLPAHPLSPTPFCILVPHRCREGGPARRGSQLPLLVHVHVHVHLVAAAAIHRHCWRPSMPVMMQHRRTSIPFAALITPCSLLFAIAFVRQFGRTRCCPPPVFFFVEAIQEHP